jgi:transketolase
MKRGGTCADLTGSLKMNAFADAHPERFFRGIAEANMMCIMPMTVGGKSLSRYLC